MEITFAEVTFRRPHRKGTKIVFAAQGEPVEALPKIARWVASLGSHESRQGDSVKIVHHSPSPAELEQGLLIVPRIGKNDAIEIIDF